MKTLWKIKSDDSNVRYYEERMCKEVVPETKESDKEQKRVFGLGGKLQSGPWNGELLPVGHPKSPRWVSRQISVPNHLLFSPYLLSWGSFER